MADTREFLIDLGKAINSLVGQNEGATGHDSGTTSRSPSAKHPNSSTAPKSGVPNFESKETGKRKTTGATGPWSEMPDSEVSKYIVNAEKGFRGTNANVHDYLKILAYLLKSEFSGQKLRVTSGYRSPEKQADVMIGNWKQNGGLKPLAKPQNIKGVVAKTYGARYILSLYGVRHGKLFLDIVENNSPDAARSKVIELEKNEQQRHVAKGSSSHMTGAAVDFGVEARSFWPALLKRSMEFASVHPIDESKTAAPHFHVQVNSIYRLRSEQPPRVGSAFPLSYKTAFQITVEPYNSVVNEELTNMSSHLGQNYFSYTDKTGKTIQINKVVLEDGDPGHFGMVRSDNPSTIYLSLNKIRSATSGSIDEKAMRAAIREILAHEMGHWKDNMQGGEGPAETEANRVKGLFSNQTFFSLRTIAELEAAELFNEAAIIRRSIGIKNAFLDTHLQPQDVSASILRIIYHFVQKVKPENQRRYVLGLVRKFQAIDLNGLALKHKNPGGGVGQVMALVKNILAGLEPSTITDTMRLTFQGMTELAK
jgi:hypothetical protein